MNTHNNITIVPDCQQTMPEAAHEVVALYAEEAKKYPEMPIQPRKIKRLQKEVVFLFNECVQRAEQLGNAWKNALNILFNYAVKSNLPWYENGRGTTESEALQRLYTKLNDFLNAVEAEPMTFCSVSIEWKKSATWGWCPRAYVRINDHSGEYRASGCGYDKLSAAVYHALKSPALTRFAIENADKLKWLYGYSENYWLPEIDFAGCGLSTFETLLEYAGWPKYQSHRRNYDRNGTTIGAYYSQN